MTHPQNLEQKARILLSRLSYMLFVEERGKPPIGESNMLAEGSLEEISKTIQEAYAQGAQSVLDKIPSEDAINRQNLKHNLIDLLGFGVGVHWVIERVKGKR